MKNRDLKNLSLPLNTTNISATVNGINRNSPSRSSIKVVLPPVIPNSTKDGLYVENVLPRQSKNPSFQRQITCPEQSISCHYSDTNNDCYTKPSMQQIPEQDTISMFSSFPSTVPEQPNSVDVERSSPGSFNEQFKFNRYSSASLDSGRGSDSIKLPSSQLNRVSVHSCESIGSTSSNKDSESSQQSSSLSSSSSTSSSFCSSSSSSSSSYQNQYCNRTLSSSSSIASRVDSITPIGDSNIFMKYKACPSPNKMKNFNSSNDETNKVSNIANAGPLSIAEMILHGVSDSEMIHIWLQKVKLHHYEKNFNDSAYDMATISRMTPQDLTAIGITDPSARSTLTSEIQKLKIPENIPSFIPNSLEEWLKLLNLDCYYSSLIQQGYNTIDRVMELTWEDLEDVGIHKLGHQKKILLAIKKVKTLKSKSAATNKVANDNSISPPKNGVLFPFQNIASSYMNGNISHPEHNVVISSNSTSLPYQDVSIKMYANSKLNSPTNPEPFDNCSIISHNNVVPSCLFNSKPQMRTFKQMSGVNQFKPDLSCPPIINGIAYQQSQSNSLFNSRGKSLESLDNSDQNYSQHQFYNLPNYPNPMFKPSMQHSSGDLYCLNRQTVCYDSNSTMYGLNDGQFPNQNYEVDGTATLNRPKNLIKSKPVAKIVASSRQIDGYDSFDSDSIKSNDSNEKFSHDSGYDTYSLYSSLKKRPPPPPKRVNSIRKLNSLPTTPVHSLDSYPMFDSNHIYVNTTLPNNSSFDEIDLCNKYNTHNSEDVFASCVKNLTTRFSEMHSLKETDNDLRHTNGTTQPNNISHAFTLPMNKKEMKLVENCNENVNVSSSSSTESMPFANDNVGTIRQKSSNFLQNALKYYDTNSKHSSSSSSSSTSSPLFNKNISDPIVNSPTVGNNCQPFLNDNLNLISPRNNVVNSLEHIELMLANIKTQLDSID